MNKEYIHKDTRTDEPLHAQIETLTRWQDPTIEEMKKEIERLKAREQECIDKYLAESKYRSEVEGKYVLAKYVIDELEKWLEESKKYGSLVYSEIKEDGSFEEFIKLEEIKNKLKELKEGK